MKRPAFEKESYSFTIDENETGTVLGKVKASDPDIYTATNGTLYYSLEGEDAAPFTINKSNGEISVKDDADLDYEAKASYSFDAVVTDTKYEENGPGDCRCE